VMLGRLNIYVRAAFAEGWKAAGGKLPDKK
jgi:hypothetical protein